MTTEPDPSSSSPRDKLILIIDDDDSIRAVLTMCLTMEGFLVATAVDGQDAAAKIEKRVPDLIISDLVMPGQGGFDFLRMLSGSDAGRVPVFIISGNSLAPEAIAALKSETGAVEFFKKPLAADALTAAAHRRLKTARA